MSREDHEKNRATWNRAVDLHVNHPDYRTREVINGGSSLKRIELEALGDVRGKHLLHMMCQFGLDTLSWARQGATVVGADISDRSIQVANELKVQAGLEAEFVRSDVLDLIGRIDRKFDIVFQSYGTHMWISDLNAWARVIEHHLKPGGVFFMIDEHPINPLFLFPQENPDYFAPEPVRTFNPPDYCETKVHIEGEHVEWQHPVSHIVNALISAGLTIERLDEYNFGYYRVAEGWYETADHYWYPPDGPTKYPLMLAVKARKRPA
jgi:SAM-dependent methyltransferase